MKGSVFIFGLQIDNVELWPVSNQFYNNKPYHHFLCADSWKCHFTHCTRKICLWSYWNNQLCFGLHMLPQSITCSATHGQTGYLSCLLKPTVKTVYRFIFLVINVNVLNFTRIIPRSEIISHG